MSRLEEMGHREELRTRRKIIEAEISSHSDSIRAALPLTGEPEDIPAAPGAPEDVAEEQDRRARAAGDRAAAPQSWTLHIANITLPNVKDAQDFFTELQAAATEMGESMA